MRAENMIFASALLLPVPAQALCTSFGVSATALDFGVYDPAGTAATQSTGSVTVECGIGVLPSFTIALSKGHGSYTQRAMAGTAGMLNYNLYADAAHMTVWGDGNDGTVTQGLSGLIALGSTKYTVYGLAPAGQYPAPDTYSDLITVTVNF
ncbi:MAG TPA: spore coat U domain-containing protein [Rhizomicrobium sp.]